MKISNILNFVSRTNIADRWSLITDNGGSNSSLPLLITGNVTNRVLVEPSPGNMLIIKGLTIIGEGNQGKVYIERENGTSECNVLLPAYFSAQSRAGASSALNIILDMNEKLILNTTDRNGETFVGVSYVEMKA